MQNITKRTGISKGIMSQFNSPFYLLLFPFFYIMNKVNEVFGLIPFKYIAVALGYSVVFIFLLFVIGKIIYRTNTKAYCWAAMLLIIFFFFGSFHDFLKGIHLPHFFVSYTFLLPVIFLCIIIFSYSIYPNNISLRRMGSFFSVLFVIFFFIEVATFSYKKINNEVKKNDLSINNKPPLIKLSAIAPENRPDIFFIVFDEYASSYSLEKYLGFINNIDSLLISKQFFVAKKAKSNYNSTPLSIGSTFNLDYFNLPLEDEFTTPLLMLKGQYSCKISLLPRLLVENGYAIINRGFFELNNQPVPSDNIFSSEVIDNIFAETLWGRVKKEIWWNTKLKPFTFPNLANPKWDMVTWNRYNYEEVIKELHTQQNQPKFVYAHIMMPHRDYHFTRTGKRRAKSPNDIMPGINDSLYLEQLMYTNTWINDIANAADNSKFHRPRIIIIEGDHGFRARYSWKKPALPEKEFMNLNAFYFSDKDYSLLYDSITPVNTFRIVLNKYFNTNLPLLKDSTIFLY